MADSPLNNGEGPVRVLVSSEGVAVSDLVQLVSVRIDRAVNRVPSARLVFDDGDISNQAFPVSESDTFKPGAAITIKAGYGDSEETIFEGIVVKHGLQISGGHEARLVVECHDEVVRMTAGRKNANFGDQTDSDIIGGLVSAHGLKAVVEETTVRHEELVQYYCSDWDFILARADANGLLIIATDGTVTVKAPATEDAPTLTVQYGSDLITFDAEIDARTQYAKTQAVSWDVETQSAVTREAATIALNAQGNLGSAALAQAMGQASYRLQTAAPTSQAMLAQWAKAQQVKAGLARIRGRMAFQGSAKARVGGLIELSGVGARFNGRVFVSAITHRIEAGEWVTEAQFGLSPEWATAQPGVTAPSAAGLLPAVEGLQIGVVKRLGGDPEGEHRVLVSVPVMQSTNDGVWARLLQFHGSNGFGAFFVPEVGDEVVLGYFNNDPSHPVILGSLYSSRRVSAYALTAENNIKAITTRCKSRIEFNEEDRLITVTTPGDNKIVLSDKDKSIVLTDRNNNRVELKAEGITLVSPKDILLSAQGKITLDAVGAINISSKADVTSSGLNVHCEAQVGFVAKGSVTTELSAAGETVIKGAIVMIN